MKLCIPVTEREGADAVVCEHFGSAPGFVFYDYKTKTYESLSNPKADHEHGQCKPMELLSGHNIAAVVCKGMGKNAVAAMERAGIKVFTTQGRTVQDIVDDFTNGNLVKINSGSSCTAHHCH